jgi:NADP-dependent 3-hydroxy acid dehydrogenase YdfG
LFAQEGCKVVLAARRLERLEELANEIRNLGGDALSIAVDVTQLAQIESMVKAAVDHYGRIDILFNNAGFGRLDWFETLDPIQDIQAQIHVDLLGVIWAARAVLPQMYKQRSGHIINMSSVAGWAAPPLYSVYSAAKFGVRGFSEALRREAAPFGVRVSTIYPGNGVPKTCGDEQSQAALPNTRLAAANGRGCSARAGEPGEAPAPEPDPASHDGTISFPQFPFHESLGFFAGAGICALS